MITGEQCRQWRQLCGIRQGRLAWEIHVDAALVSRWELGLGKLRPEKVEAIERYLAEKFSEIKALEFPKQVAL